MEAQAGQLWRDGGKKAERGEARVWRKAHSVRLTHGPGLAAAQGGGEKCAGLAWGARLRHGPAGRAVRADPAIQTKI